MKIKVIYSGGKNEFNPQEDGIDLELILLGLRKNVYVSNNNNILSTFEMLKEQLYFYIKNNNLNIKNKFVYNKYIHSVLNLYENEIDDYDYLNSYKNYIFNNFDNKISQDELKKNYLEYYSNMDFFFRDLKNKILKEKEKNQKKKISNK